MKTNAVRTLDRAGIAYELRYYQLEMEQFSAERVAAELGLAAEMIFKTLITRGDTTGPLFALIPANMVLDVRALADVSGNKRIELASLHEVLPLTGYQRGAVTALAAKRAYPVYIDETVELWPQVGVSGGMRGLQILLAPADLIRVVEAHLVDIARANLM